MEKTERDQVKDPVLSKGLRYTLTKPLQSINKIPLFSHNSNCLYSRRRSLTSRIPLSSFNKKLNKPISPSLRQEPIKKLLIEIHDNSKQQETKATKRRSKWTLIRCVIRAVTLFQISKTETINNEEEFNKALENVKPRKESYNRKQLEYEEHFREKRFYDLVARGDTDDIREIEEILRKDRRAHLYELGNPCSLINSPNSMGTTPLYIATQNGNLAMIKYLISKKANPLINSKVSATRTESNLLVAARWKHAKIIEFYLNFYNWPYDELKRAKKEAGNTHIKQILSKHIKATKPNSCFTFCRLVK